MATTTNYLDPQNGETPIADLPSYGGAGGGSQAQQYYAGQDFYKLFGRNPTQSELMMLSGAYGSGDPNRANLSAGSAAIAQYYQSLSNNPANLYQQQQQKWNQTAPEHYDAVNSVFKNLLGRSATQDELSHYGTLLSSGQADTYQLGQFLQALPEYQNSQDTKFRSNLDTQLQQSDQNFFNTGKEDVISRYAQMGRTTSPALDVALTDLQAKLNQNRQGYLAQLSASQYGSNKDAAIANYGQTQNDVLSRINQNPNYQYAGLQNLNKRVQDISDYNTQALNYGQMMSRYGPKGPGALDYLNTAFNGIQAGAKAYAAAGA